MERQQLKFVIIGHVDHGKSTIIGRLLYDTGSLHTDKIEEIKKTSSDLGRDIEFAYLLDHLEEERLQGITIDTAQVFFKTDKREYVIIDAPGHIEFVKNMITGASQAEAALLIVDATSGIKEQTKRHATIISLLGIDQIIVAINKMDSAGFNEDVYNNLKDEVGAFLNAFNISALNYIPISALKGDNITKPSSNMPWYKGNTILECLDFLKNRSLADEQALIFPIQDIYKIDEKRIAVGRIETGKITQGKKVKILPEWRITKINSIEKFLESPQICYAGESIGITTEDAVFIDRGDIICEADAKPKVTDNFKANVFWMSKDGYIRGEKILLRCATQEIICKIEKIHKRINSSSLEVIEEDAGELKNLEIGEVLIKAKRPIVVETFKAVQELGRFVLVNNDNISAGGIITDVI